MTMHHQKFGIEPLPETTYIINASKKLPNVKLTHDRASQIVRRELPNGLALCINGGFFAFSTVSVSE